MCIDADTYLPLFIYVFCFSHCCNVILNCHSLRIRIETCWTVEQQQHQSENDLAYQSICVYALCIWKLYNVIPAFYTKNTTEPCYFEMLRKSFSADILSYDWALFGFYHEISQNNVEVKNIVWTHYDGDGNKQNYSIWNECNVK